MTARDAGEILHDLQQLDLIDVLRDGRVCAWCKRPRLEHPNPATRKDWVYGNKRCRQASHRFGKGAGPSRRVTRSTRDASRPAMSDAALRVAFADPPYPEKAHLYVDHPDYGGEVDHKQLVDRLTTDYPDGWALCTRPGSLQYVLSLCPTDVRIASWTRRRATGGASYSPIGAWEPVILRGGRPLAVRDPDGNLTAQRVLDADVLDVTPEQEPASALVYRGRYAAFPGALIGMKPPQFSAWVFDMLGLRAGDQLDDLYPGSGAVTRAWERHTRGAPQLPRHLRAG